MPPVPVARPLEATTRPAWDATYRATFQRGVPTVSTHSRKVEGDGFYMAVQGNKMVGSARGGEMVGVAKARWRVHLQADLETIMML